MYYSLTDLLTKMGAPNVQEKGRVEWHYFDKATNDLAGFAEIRMEAGGARLVAELKHTRQNFRDEDNIFHDTHTETFLMVAERAGANRYGITTIAFDGEEYAHPQKAVVELGLSIFHARALDISIRMVEQAFNKQDILEPQINLKAEFSNVPKRLKRPVFPAPAKKDEKPSAVILPFRPRAVRRMGM